MKTPTKTGRYQTPTAEFRFNQLLMFIIFFRARAESRQFCGGISLQIGCVTGLQALTIGPDMDVYMAGDCCGLI